MNVLEYIKQPNWCIKLQKTKTREAMIIKQTLIVQTPFLPEHATLQQRAWHIRNNINQIPPCPVCADNLKFQKNGQYSKYCSQKCTALSPETVSKKKASNIEKYGSEEAYRKASADKLKEISLKKYGVENLFQASEVKEKSKKTMLENYGVDHPALSDELSNKRKATMMEKYGVEHALQLEEFKNKFTATMLENYGVEHALSSSTIQQYLSKKFKTKYGVEHHTQQHINLENLSKLNDSSWLKMQHHEKMKTIDDIASQLSVDKKTVSRYIRRYGIDIKRFSNSLPERELREALKQFGDVITNDRVAIAPYELDVYLPQYKIAIEYCGLYWHSEDYKNKTYHSDKYNKCKALGIRLITIFESEWKRNKTLIINKLIHILGENSSDKVYARNTKVVSVDTESKSSFFEDNHIQGDGPSSINYGLEYNGELVACIGFIKQKEHFILNRYATSSKVIGGFTKLLKYFEKEYDTPKIVTFADLRWSDGELYNTTGFVKDAQLPPDYYWTKNKILWHKFNWRHTSGLKKLENYDSNKTENENMYEHGFRKIWDCGKIRFTKN